MNQTTVVAHRRYTPVIQKMLAKDAPFHWFLFDRAKQHSRYHFSDFQQQACRLESHLDGIGSALAIGQPVQDWLNLDDWGSVFVLAALAIRYQRMDLFQQALGQLDEKHDTHYREIIDACLWDHHHHPLHENWLLLLHKHASPLAAHSCLGLLRIQQRTLTGDTLQHYLVHRHPAVQVQLLNWIGEQQQVEQLSYIQQRYDEHTPKAIRFAAARAGFLLADAGARAPLEQFALTENVFMLDAISLIFIKERCADTVKQWLNQVWHMDNIAIRVKLYSTAIAGFPELMERLLEYMTDQPVARAAGESFTLLTGVDLEEHGLDSHEKEADSDYDRPTSPVTKEKPFTNDWEQDLPYPDVDACYLWWEDHQSAFDPQQRYLAGLPVTEDNLKRILQEGNQRQRPLAALHLSLNYNYPWQDPNWPRITQGSGE